MSESSRRWRLLLGRYADPALPLPESATDMEQALAYLYDREYQRRGLRSATPGGGSLDPSALTALEWLGRAGELFPPSTLVRMERDAMARYGLTELLADPDVVDRVDASPQLAAALLRIRGRIDPSLQEGVRRLIERVIEEAVQRLRPRFETAVRGARARHVRATQRSSRTFDPRATVKANLGHVGPDGVMRVSDVRFVARQRRQHLDWQVIVLVDQSGSMAESVLHSAVCAAVMAGLPGVHVRLLLFDTSVVDMSHLATDPLEVLMTAQLGGGTDIAAAVRYASQLVTQPTRTVLTLISDFDEGGSVSQLVRATRALVASGVRVLGLAPLSDGGEVWFNRDVAQRLADVGAEVASMSLDQLAAWLGEVMA